MTESALQAPPEIPAQAMDEALDWLIVLANPTPAQCQAFDAWLACDPTHIAAYAKASAAWRHTAIDEGVPALPAPVQSRRHRRGVWPGLAVAALVLLGIAIYVL